MPDVTAISPDGYSLDNFYLARPGADEIQLDLFGDYKSNVALYPTFRNYFRTHKPSFLAVWGKNDPFFLPGGAEAFRRDIPGAIIPREHVPGFRESCMSNRHWIEPTDSITNIRGIYPWATTSATPKSMIWRATR